MPSLPARTTKFRLLDHLLRADDGLEAYVNRARSAGISWRLIAMSLYDRTEVDVTHETLRAWFGDGHRLAEGG